MTSLAPAWDLSDLYPLDREDRVFTDLETLKDTAHAFQTRHQGRLKEYSAADLAQTIQDYEALEEAATKASSYGALRYEADLNTPETGRLFQRIQETVAAIENSLVFFALEMTALESDTLEQGYRSCVALEKYRPWLRDLRLFAPHRLSLEVESVLHQKHMTSSMAWRRLFDETLGSLRFEIEGQEYALNEVTNFLSDPDPSKRREAAQALGSVLGRHAQTFSLILNTLVYDKSLEDSWRGYARAESERHLSNCVDQETVDALVTAVKESYPRLSHRYYRLKARWLGSDRLDYWDRNAPLALKPEPLIPWPEARRIVLDAYREFSDEMAAIAERFFTGSWIDAEIRNGKASGGFCHPTVPSVHPYILVNFHGKSQDVMTLAHELGHGIHQTLAAPLGLLRSRTPLTLAETASVFGEMLTFHSLLKRESDPDRRRTYLIHQVEKQLNTVIRQIAFFEFERRVHHQRRISGELTAQTISQIWRESQIESLGPALRFDDRFDHFWAYIPHFIHVPFYVYSYAFGECLVNSLFALYQKHDPHEFEQAFLDVLRAGGTKTHQELFTRFEFDLTQTDFWRQGLDMIDSFIDRLEELD